jgi:PKD repeat protein
MTLGAYASNSVLQAATSTIGYTLTTTSSYSVTQNGNLQVKFDSIQLTNAPPQAYSFGVVAQTSPGLSITQLVWQFGDGSGITVPYCCQSQVSEVRYHAYSQPGPYTVTVWAFDNGGNVANAIVTVNWVTPLPEYSMYLVPMVISLFAVLFGVALFKRRT